MYDFETVMYFEAKTIPEPTFECKGTIKFFEFNQDDDEVVSEITLEKVSDFNSQVKKILNNEIAELTMKCLQSLNKAMRERDVDEIKVKVDAKNREEAKKKIEEAKATTGVKK